MAEYGPEVLAEPHQKTSWLIPVILGVLGLGTVALTARRWRRSTAYAKEPVDLDPDDNRRLERDMAGYDL